jgi:8-oxo-dGTP pyrophosphatase MutT (NUDIX family)
VADHVARMRALVGGRELLQIPSVSVAIRDGAGRVLLARHVEGDAWLIPGGAIEPGESPRIRRCGRRGRRSAST